MPIVGLTRFDGHPTIRGADSWEDVHHGGMESSKPRAAAVVPPEFKAEIVELCQRGDRSIGQVAQDFDLTETAVREWVRQAERDAGTRVATAG